jgi:hypothetical protein
LQSRYLQTDFPDLLKEVVALLTGPNLANGR